MKKPTLSQRRAVLKEVRQHIYGEYYRDWVLCLEWHSDRKHRHGNVTAYISQGGYTGVIPIREVVPDDLESVPVFADELRAKLRMYIDKMITWNEAADAEQKAFNDLCQVFSCPEIPA